MEVVATKQEDPGLRGPQLLVNVSARRQLFQVGEAVDAAKEKKRQSLR